MSRILETLQDSPAIERGEISLPKNGQAAARQSNPPQPREWLRFYSPTELRNYVPPEGHMLVGDSHIQRGSVSVIGGAPGIGKSRAAVALAVAGATQESWFGLPVRTRFKTAIIQNENGRHRLAQEFAEIRDGLDEFIRVSEPPPFGMAFDNPEFRGHLAKLLADFQPGLVIVDPWNSVARDDRQKDYLATFEMIREVLPVGESAPALMIVTHTRKPKGDERKTGRGLLNDVAGSYVLTSVPRSVFIMQAASDNPEDDRIVWSCCKNNDGQLGPPGAWHRGNGLFVPCDGFDWTEFQRPETPQKRTITEKDLEDLFEGGKRRLKRAQAAKELRERTELVQSACYNALMIAGRFGKHLIEENGLVTWKP